MMAIRLGTIGCPLQVVDNRQADAFSGAESAAHGQLPSRPLPGPG